MSKYRVVKYPDKELWIVQRLKDKDLWVDVLDCETRDIARNQIKVLKDREQRYKADLNRMW